VIIRDINLLGYAYNQTDPAHPSAKFWWEKLLNGNMPVGIAWIVSSRSSAS
jgi:predicted nucleic acid-binding protein